MLKRACDQPSGKHWLSSRPFRRFRGITVDLFSNDPFRSFVQILIERVLDLQIFRPEEILRNFLRSSCSVVRDVYSSPQWP